MHAVNGVTRRDKPNVRTLSSTVVRKNSASKPSMLLPRSTQSHPSRRPKGRPEQASKPEGLRCVSPARRAERRLSANKNNKSKICWELPTTNCQRQLTARSQKPIHNHKSAKPLSRQILSPLRTRSSWTLKASPPPAPAGHKAGVVPAKPLWAERRLSAQISGGPG